MVVFVLIAGSSSTYKKNADVIHF